MMLKATFSIVLLLTASCSRQDMPLKEVRVQITRDGKCVINGQGKACATLGQDLVTANPGNEVQVMLDVDPQADYTVLASAMGSIRTSGIEKTLFVTRRQQP